MATVATLGTGRLRSRKYNFKKIVVATDFSSAAERALEYAIAIARQYYGDVTIVHAVAPEPHQSVPMDPLPHEIDLEYAEAEAQMGGMDRRLESASVPHQTVLQRGRASDVVQCVIQQNKADLLVLGTRGRTGLSRLVLGSVAEELLRTVECPVLTVGQRAARAPEAVEFKTILFATDFGPGSEKAFQYAARIANRCKAKLILLHTVAPVAKFAPLSKDWTPPPTTAEAVVQWEDRARDESLRKLRSLVSSFSKPIEAEYAITLDFSPRAILESMALHKPDLVVMGANRPRSTRFAAHLPWTVLHGVLCGSSCPVLTISAGNRINTRRDFSTRHTRRFTKTETETCRLFG